MKEEKLSDLGVLITSVKITSIQIVFLAICVCLELLIFVGGGLLLHKITGNDFLWVIPFMIWYLLSMLVTFGRIKNKFINVIFSFIFPIIRLIIIGILLCNPIFLLIFITLWFLYNINFVYKNNI
jgi:hypothetical protein